VYLLDHSFPSPEENLACDEALLEACEAGDIDDEVLRFWESPKYFVVLGYTGKVQEEVNVAACQELNIPILRRTSGGGTVLQGPGCLNYSLILRINNSSVAGITETNEFVMQRNAAALSKVLSAPVLLQGHTDLTIGDKKFSGNAQRRKQKFLLFHGTFLLDFDLPLIARVLRTPPTQPSYRDQRSHLDFVVNIHQPTSAIKTALVEQWQTCEELQTLPQHRIVELTAEKYSLESWNLRS
jgi:lipoate-protein ligase A